MNLKTLTQNRTPEQRAADEQFAQMGSDARAAMAGWNEGRVLGMPTGKSHIVIRIDPFGLAGKMSAIAEIANSYEFREQLKTRGYKFSGARKTWFKPFATVAEARTEAEQTSAELHIQLGDAMEKHEHQELIDRRSETRGK